MLGRVYVSTDRKCREVCLMSDLPILGGLYDIQGKEGVYYEITINKMDGIIAIGESHSHAITQTACNFGRQAQHANLILTGVIQAGTA